MITCPTCGTQLEDGAKFCLECGTPIPQTKKCIKCGFELTLSAKFCPECGTKQDGSAAPASGSGFSMGDKNVIAGDVIGHKEETHIAGNATIIKNEDQTKQVKKCHICGSLVPIIEGFDCKECGQFTCVSCFDSDAGCCTNCVGQKEQNNINRYKDAIKMVLADGRIEPSERKELVSLQMQLGISSEKAAQLENEMRNAASKNELTTVEKLSLEKAHNLFYKEEQTEQALEVLEPIYDAHKHEEEILALYLPILAEVDSDKALKIIETLPFDILMSYITAIDIAIKKDELDEAERKYKEAARIWPENALVKCYQVLLNYALYKKFNQQDFLNKAKELVENIGEAQNELELSMQVRVQMFMQEVSGETVPEITQQFCDDNQLYFGVMDKDLFTEIYEIDASEAADFISKLNAKKCTIKIHGTLNDADFKILRDCIKKNERLNLSLDLSNCSIKELPKAAFVGCLNLYNIILPNTIISIGDNTFGGTFGGCLNLQTINIPDSVTTIYNNPFINCPKLKIVLSENNQHFQIKDNILYNKELSKLIAILFSNNVFTINIPNSVLEIEDYAFTNCKNLTNIIIPDSVTKIGRAAFRRCTNLKNINIPNSVTEIGGGAFQGCTSLSNINIPNSVTTIGHGAFSGCTSLTSISIPNSISKIEEDAFNGCTNLKNINIPNSVTEIGEGAFNDCTNLTNIDIPNSVTEIACFYGCTNLVKVTLPDSLKNIYEGAFLECPNLKSITIPKNCKVDDDAFDDGIEIIRR